MNEIILIIMAIQLITSVNSATIDYIKKYPDKYNVKTTILGAISIKAK